MFKFRSVILLSFFCLLIIGGALLYRQRSHRTQIVAHCALYEGYTSAGGWLEIESQESQTWAREVLADVKEGQTLDRVAALVEHLLSEAQPFMGIPDKQAKHLTGLETYAAILEGRASIWGDNLTRVYVGAANALGIPTRLVEVGIGERVAKLPCHRFAESYIAEYDKWAFVDITSRKAYIIDARGLPLDTVELFTALQEGREGELNVALFQGGTIACVPYSLHCGPEKHRLRREAKLCFPTPDHHYHSLTGRLHPKEVYALSSTH